MVGYLHAWSLIFLDGAGHWNLSNKTYGHFWMFSFHLAPYAAHRVHIKFQQKSVNWTNLHSLLILSCSAPTALTAPLSCSAQTALTAHFILWCTNYTYCSLFPALHHFHLCAFYPVVYHLHLLLTVSLVHHCTYCLFYPVVNQLHLWLAWSCSAPLALSAHFILECTNSDPCTFMQLISWSMPLRFCYTKYAVKHSAFSLQHKVFPQ